MKTLNYKHIQNADEFSFEDDRILIQMQLSKPLKKEIKI